MLKTSIRVFVYDNLKNYFDQILIDATNQTISGTKVLDVQTFTNFQEENYYNADYMDINVLISSASVNDFDDAIQTVYNTFNQRSIPIYDFVNANYATKDYGNKISELWIDRIEIVKLNSDDTYRKANLRIFYNEVRQNGK